MKKPPSFESLDFTKVSKPETDIPVATVMPDKIPAKSIEGTWINGVSIEKVTVSEFKKWLAALLPGTGVEETKDEAFASTKSKEMIVQRLGTVISGCFQFPRSQSKQKSYEN